MVSADGQRLVRLGSEADIRRRLRDGCFTPKSRHQITARPKVGRLADRLAAMAQRRAQLPHRWTPHRPVVPPEGWVFRRPRNRQALNRACEIASQKKPTVPPGGPFVADVWLKLLLFGGIALHVKVITSSPCLTTLVATRTSRLTPLVATRTSCFTPLVATCAPPLTPFHTGRCWSGRYWSGRCWSGRCWSGWLCLSLGI